MRSSCALLRRSSSSLIAVIVRALSGMSTPHAAAATLIDKTEAAATDKACNVYPASMPRNRKLAERYKVVQRASRHAHTRVQVSRAAASNSLLTVAINERRRFN